MSNRLTYDVISDVTLAFQDHKRRPALDHETVEDVKWIVRETIRTLEEHATLRVTAGFLAASEEMNNRYHHCVDFRTVVDSLAQIFVGGVFTDTPLSEKEIHERISFVEKILGQPLMPYQEGMLERIFKGGNV